VDLLDLMFATDVAVPIRAYRFDTPVTPDPARVSTNLAVTTSLAVHAVTARAAIAIAR
jgi:hypothetical protein